ncbi:MAG: SDR family oxidoreductase [Candidatus Cloacimonetes bacterium]|nr:SDR family oxidoreductase [Candidatus Cloacimonadota bacterium]
MSKQPKTYVIYGANSAIGSELAKSVLPDVNDLVLFYHDKTDNIQSILSHEKVTSFKYDIKDFEGIIEQVNHIKKDRHFAAVYLPTMRSYDAKPLFETSLYLTKDIIETNFLGAIHFLKAMITLMPARAKESLAELSMRIVMLGSNVTRTGLKNGSVYAASKAAIANLCRSVAMEEGVNNILINTISPGPVLTDNSGYKGEYLEYRKEYFENQKAATSLNRLAEIQDVCQAIKFLTSMENQHITGEEIFLTGGSL